MRYSILTLSAALLSAPAFAADLGTYRPGTPYHSVVVPTANVCESQCEGDAQCRGWNYVKAAPQAPGVCEFQSSLSNPVPSPISISGISGSVAPTSSRIVEGNTNTLRVGTASIATPIAASTQTQSGRRIIRQAVPQQMPVLGGPVRMPQQNFVPQGAYNPYAAPAQPAQRPRTHGPMHPPAQMGQYPNAMAPQPYAAQPSYGVPAYQGRPPVGQPIAPQSHAMPHNNGWSYSQGAQATPSQSYTPSIPSQAMPRSSVNQPVTWSSAPAQTPSTGPRTAGEVAQSLYGHLNDDVSQTSQMGTVQSYPTQPVTQSALAGGVYSR